MYNKICFHPTIPMFAMFANKNEQVQRGEELTEETLEQLDELARKASQSAMMRNSNQIQQSGVKQPSPVPRLQEQPKVPPSQVQSKPEEQMEEQEVQLELPKKKKVKEETTPKQVSGEMVE